MAELFVTTQTINSTTVVIKISGGLDADNFFSLEDEFSKMLESGITRVVLDASGLESVSSAGIGAFVHFSVMLADRGGKLSLAAPTENIRGLLDLLSLTDPLSVTDTPEEARRLLESVK